MSTKQTSDDLRVSVLSVDSVDEEKGASVHPPPVSNSSTSTRYSVLWNTTWKKVILGVIMSGIVITLCSLAGFGFLHGASVAAAVVGSETLHSYPLVRVLLMPFVL